MTSGVRQCAACGLPVFSGAYAYAGDVCKCSWTPIPRFKQPVDLSQRVEDLERQVSYLMRRIEEVAK